MVVMQKMNWNSPKVMGEIKRQIIGEEGRTDPAEGLLLPSHGEADDDLQPQRGHQQRNKEAKGHKDPGVGVLQRSLGEDGQEDPEAAIDLLQPHKGHKKLEIAEDKDQATSQPRIDGQDDKKSQRRQTRKNGDFFPFFAPPILSKFSCDNPVYSPAILKHAKLRVAQRVKKKTSLRLCTTIKTSFDPGKDGTFHATSDGCKESDGDSAGDHAEVEEALDEQDLEDEDGGEQADGSTAPTGHASDDQAEEVEDVDDNSYQIDHEENAQVPTDDKGVDPQSEDQEDGNAADNDTEDVEAYGADQDQDSVDASDKDPDDESDRDEDDYEDPNDQEDDVVPLNLLSPLRGSLVDKVREKIILLLYKARFKMKSELQLFFLIRSVLDPG